MAAPDLCETVWGKKPLSVVAHLIPRYAWMSASIDVVLDGQRILKTGGVLKVTSTHLERFQFEGASHTAELSWGNASLRSFPFSLKIDKQVVVEGSVPMSNWWLALWPWALLLGFLVWSLVK